MAPKAELVRLAITAESGGTGSVVIDRLGRMPGRGAYLCRVSGSAEPAPECLRTALRRGGIVRTLRSRVPIAPEIVESTDGGQETRS